MNVKILYIEDDPTNIRLIQKMLRITGYSVVVAENGLDGYRMATQEMPDLILMDINLPDIDGLEVTRRLRANPATRDIPVIALTAGMVGGGRGEAISAGCNEYVPKPTSRPELLKILQQYLKYVNPLSED
jgi:CheY-like chemotaxis protein